MQATTEPLCQVGPIPAKTWDDALATVCGRAGVSVRLVNGQFVAVTAESQARQLLDDLIDQTGIVMEIRKVPPWPR